VKQRVVTKKDQQIDDMSNELVVNELKEKRLDTFGTIQQKRDRLKRFYGELLAYFRNLGFVV